MLFANIQKRFLFYLDIFFTSLMFYLNGRKKILKSSSYLVPRLLYQKMVLCASIFVLYK